MVINFNARTKDAKNIANGQQPIVSVATSSLDGFLVPVISSAAVGRIESTDHETIDERFSENSTSISEVQNTCFLSSTNVIRKCDAADGVMEVLPDSLAIVAALNAVISPINRGTVTEKKLCNFFSLPSSCKKGDACNFSHEVGVVPVDAGTPIFRNKAGSNMAMAANGIANVSQAIISPILPLLTSALDEILVFEPASMCLMAPASVVIERIGSTGYEVIEGTVIFSKKFTSINEVQNAPLSNVICKCDAADGVLEVLPDSLAIVAALNAVISPINRGTVTEKKLCNFFSLPSSCKKGDACNFSHEVGVVPVDAGTPIFRNKAGSNMAMTANDIANVSQAIISPGDVCPG